MKIGGTAFTTPDYGIFLLPKIIGDDKMKLVDELKDRGLIYQMTYPEELEQKLNEESITFYVGFDCTADSLTAGHYLVITLMKRLQMAGHKPICLIGGGTTLIGDPSGRNDMRSLMGTDFIDHNAERFKAQLSRFLNIDGVNGFFANNGDWLRNLNFLDFNREIGVHFLVNNMLNLDSYKNRLKDGLTFFEFSYMLLQSYDFLKLYRDYGCTLQVGGSDQWSNILGGYDLVRKIENANVYAMTIPLLVNADGVKMGKSMGNAIWLDEEKTSVYDLYQYFRNVDDRDVEKFLKQLTFLSLDNIDDIIKNEDINRQKEILAFEITKDIHGEEKARTAMETARSLFSGEMDLLNMPSFEIDKELIKDGIGILNLLVETGLCSSNSEARNLVKGGGVTIDDEKIDDPRATLNANRFEKDIVIKKGKKTFLKVSVK